jgi:hypothetical protein
LSVSRPDPETGLLQFSFVAVPNRSYTLQAMALSGTSQWSTVSNVPPGITRRTVNIDISLTDQTDRAFRVVTPGAD